MNDPACLLFWIKGLNMGNQVVPITGAVAGVGRPLRSQWTAIAIGWIISGRDSKTGEALAGQSAELQFGPTDGGEAPC